jgi:hypothetical protein
MASLARNWTAYDIELPAQFIDIGHVLSESGGEIIHFVHEQNDAGLLNAPGGDPQRFIESTM